MSWLAIALIGIGSLGFRASFLVLAPDVTIPPRAMRALAVAAPVLLAAITAPEIAVGDSSLLAARIAGAAVAVAVSWRTRSIAWTVATGLAVYWAVELLIGR
ncbi:MAG: AzlD domain-containing protein [Aquihabitans sp.]